MLLSKVQEKKKEVKNQWLTEVVISKSLLCAHQKDSMQMESTQTNTWNEA